jgi:hypothetical protein
MNSMKLIDVFVGDLIVILLREKNINQGGRNV